MIPDRLKEAVMRAAWERYDGLRKYWSGMFEASLQRSSDLSLADMAKGKYGTPTYCKDLKLAFCILSDDEDILEDRAEVVKLSNAMQPDKTCRRLKIECISGDANLCSLLAKNGVQSAKALYRAMCAQTKIDGVEYCEDMLESELVYSPFVEIAPLEAPEKWEGEHVWRALLSGQIYRGTLCRRYGYEDALTDCLCPELTQIEMIPDQLRRLGVTLRKDHMLGQMGHVGLALHNPAYRVWDVDASDAKEVKLKFGYPEFYYLFYFSPDKRRSPLIWH